MKRPFKLVLLAGIVVVLGLMGFQQVAAQDFTVTRRISPTSVPAGGGEVTVTIDISGSYGNGAVVETLPSGFSYVDGSVMPSDITSIIRDGQKWTFPLLGETSFTYRVMTSASAGTHNFPSGSKLIYGLDKTEVSVTGATQVTVAAQEVAPPQSGITVTRRISPTSVPAGGGEVTVTIDISGSYGNGAVVETLPSGFSYVDGSVMPSDITSIIRDGQKWTFPLLGETSFTYRVMTSASAGTHNFPSGSKLIYGLDKTEVPVGGASRITVGTGTMPGPSEDPCLETLSADGAVIGAWSSSCESTDQVGSYARYYSFMLTEGSNVTISLESSTDPYLYLRTGAAKSGTASHENDDVVPGTDINSRIQETLGAGTYTIEATTYGAGATGSFTLTVSGLEGGTMPGPSEDPCLETLSADGAVIGAWSSSCESTDQVGSYARYYSFMLTEGSNVTISLESSTDPYLYLRTGAAKSGTASHENDDVVPGTDINSRIQETLGAGTYTIEATTYGAGATGSFTLTVSGLEGGTMPGPSEDPCLETLSADGAVIGAWSSSCESTDQVGSYARYYSFMLTEGSNVTISLESSTDPYLYLRTGAAEVWDGVARERRRSPWDGHQLSDTGDAGCWDLYH